MTKKELEEILGYKITDEEWRENKRIFSEVAEKEWEELHPLEE